MNKDTRMNFFIRCLIFVGIFVISFIFLECFFAENTPVFDGWAYTYQDDIDILIMGSSVAHHGFDGSYITEETGKSTVVFSSNAQSVQQTYYNLKEVLKYQSPDVVFVEEFGISIDTLKWIKDKEQTGLILDGMRGMKMSPLKLIYGADVLGKDFFDMFELTIQTGRTERIVNALNDPIKALRDIFVYEEIPLSPERGSLLDTTGEMVTLEDYNRYLEKLDYESDYVAAKSSIKYMDKIIRLCEKNDVDLVFVKVPMLKRGQSNTGHEQIVDYISANGYDVPCINLMIGDDKIIMERSDYMGINHLTQSGAQKVSAWVVEYLEEVIFAENAD